MRIKGLGSGFSQSVQGTLVVASLSYKFSANVRNFNGCSHIAVSITYCRRLLGKPCSPPDL